MRCKKRAQKAVGLTKGGINTKIHAVVDALGNPVKFILSEGERYDSKFLIPLLRELKINNCNVLADRAYDTDEIIEYINTNNANPIIPPKSNRKIKRNFDEHIYKERHLVECLFQKLKWFRRIFVRFEKPDSSFFAFLLSCFFHALVKINNLFYFSDKP